MAKGYLALVLHAHLPFVRHPEYENFLEEDWLYEAITETYIPLINVFDNLIKDDVDFRVTMNISPPLANMLADPLLQSRYERKINQLIELMHKELERTAMMPEFNQTAKMYLERFLQSRHTFVNEYHRNLLNAFKKFQSLGKLEIITCGATHGFMPNMQLHPGAVNAQIATAVQSHRSLFETDPQGIWNGECGYFPGLEDYLKKHGIRYFFVDTHGILHADRKPRYGTFAPILCKNGVAAFGRDIESSKSVWSSIEGYPGDFNYREFYRDIGFDLDYDYIKPYIHESGIRINTGVKYYRITGKGDYKEPYNRQLALQTAASHAGNFMFNREKQAEHLANFMDRPPLIVSPYDAELFGHWWFEGPEFINYLCRKIYHDQDNIVMITPSEYLKLHPKNQVATPSFSSWGYKGYSEFWLEDSNAWIYRHLHKAAERMEELAKTYKNGADGIILRALNQAARELLLAQSSDWAFIIKTGTMVEYAIKRTNTHIDRFTKLYYQIKDQAINESFLLELEWKDNIFPEINYINYLA